MNWKLRRVIRTPHSEKIALFDLDERGADGAPVNCGLLHLHYGADEVAGTLLLAPAYWQRVQQRRAAPGGSNPLAYLGGQNSSPAPVPDDESALISLVDGLMQEVCETRGVAGACRVWIGFAAPDQRLYVTNSLRLAALDQPDNEPTPDDESPGPRTLFGG